MRWAINQITLAGGSCRPPAPEDLPRDLAAVRAGGWTAVELWLFSARFEARWRADRVGASRQAYRACRALTDRTGRASGA